MDYQALHLHSHFSLMDGVSSPIEYAERAKEIGMSAVAITDHGTLSGHREWVRAMTNAGIKPILGIEAYYCPDISNRRSKKDRSGPLDQIYNHLVILAKNPNGLRNLNKLNEIAWVDGFFQKPRMDWEMLSQYGDDLIISSACMGGPINQAIENGDFAAAKSFLDRFQNRFGENFYAEVMPHNTEGMNTNILELADAMGIPTIVTPDCHHADSSQREIQEFMLLTQTHAKLQKDVTFEKSLEYSNMMDRLNYLYGEDRRMSFQNFDIHLMSGDEMWEAMGKDGVKRADIFDNTCVIADSIEPYDLKENLNLLPAEYRNPDKQLRQLAIRGLKKRGMDSQEYWDRLDEELKVIADKDLSSYFIIIYNMVNWAHKKDILVGPGRGSAAGSLVCYSLKITNVDPIEYGLLFSRFLDPERDDPADVDLDLADNRRDEVKQYLVNRYRHVANISTYSTFKDKVVIRDISRVLNIPLGEVNKVLKTLDTWEEFEFGKSARYFREKYPEVVEYGLQIRGRIRGVGVHPAGVITSKTAISNYVPIETRSIRGGDRVSVVAADMEEVDRIGLIKIDALGLKTLTVIHATIKSIKSRLNEDIVLENIPLDDRKVYRMLSDGHTMGCFQVEAAAYTKLLMEMGVDSFDDLATSNALVRPGARNTIGKELIDRKHGVTPVTYIPGMKDFTSNTYGEIVYQEQVMQACVTLGGLSVSESNKVRKIIGKKKDASELDKYRNKFVSGATPKVGAEVAEKLWHDFEEHASYSFNLSHAVSYSMISYWTAWLKLYYPQDYMVSLLNYGSSNDSITGYLIETKRVGIPILLPHINKSSVDFKIEGNGIRMGLSAIKWISGTIAERYIAKAPYDSYNDVREMTLTKGSGVNSRALAAMNSVGALSFKDNPPDHDKIRESLYELLSLPEFGMSLPDGSQRYITECMDYDDSDTMIMFGMVESIKRGKGWSRVELLDKTGSTGIFDKQDSQVESGKMYLLLVSENRIVKADSIDDIESGRSSLNAYLKMDDLELEEDESFVLAFKSRTTKKGEKMGTMILVDNDKQLSSIVVWPSNYPDAFVKVKAGKKYRLILTQSRKNATISYKGIQL